MHTHTRSLLIFSVAAFALAAVAYGPFGVFLGQSLPQSVVRSSSSGIPQDNDLETVTIVTGEVLVRLSQAEAQAVRRAVGFSEEKQARASAGTSAIPRPRAVKDLSILNTFVQEAPTLSAAREKMKAVELVSKTRNNRMTANKDAAVLPPIDRWVKVIMSEKREVPVLASAMKQTGPAVSADPFKGWLIPGRIYSEAEKQALQETIAIRQMMRQRGAEKTAFNLLMSVQMIPNDSYYTHEAFWGMRMIEAHRAWDVTQGSGVTVAVIDTGIDYLHEDIDDNIWHNPGETGGDGNGGDKRTNGVDDDGNGYIDDWRGWDFANDDNDPADGHGHGTHVAGTIAAEGNNGVGVIGVAPAAGVVAIKGLSDDGHGEDSDLAEAIRYAADLGADLSNNSWGGRGRSEVLDDAFAYARQRNMINVVAAGNNAADVTEFSPANSSGVIVVAATDSEDKRASFSNWGSLIDVAAPGVNILSLRAAGTDMYRDGAHIVGVRYFRSDGTSMAAPHVAGLVALLKAENPALTTEDARSVLRASADDVGTVEGFDSSTGWGRINANRALNATDHYPFAYLDLPKYTVINPKNSFTIKGTAAGQNFHHYTIEVGFGDPPSGWTTAGVQLTGSGLSPVTNGILGVWTPQNVAQAQPVTIKLTAFSVRGDGKTYQDHQYVDPTLRTGWPVPLGSSMKEDYYTRVAIGDVIGDANKEIIVTGADYEVPRIIVYDHHGNVFPGWPIIVPQTYGNVSSPLVGDVTNDGKDEIIVTGGYNNMYVYDGQGEILSGWPQVVIPRQVPGEQTWHRTLGMPALVDLDGDNRKDIVLFSYISYLDNDGDPPLTVVMHAWTHDGNAVAGYPRNININARKGVRWVAEFGAPTAINVDADPQLEYFFAARKNREEATSIIVGLDHDGTPLNGWPVEYGGYFDGVSIGNVSGDNNPEIIALSASGRSLYISVFDLAGQTIAPWPQETVRTTPYQDYPEHPTLFDLDSDGLQEIILGMHAYKGNGEIYDAWSVRDEGDPPYGSVRTTLNSFADIDGDNIADNITEYYPSLHYYSGDFQPSKLYSIKKNGLLPESWPKYLPFNMFMNRHPALADDLDNDGRIEVIKMINDNYRDFARQEWINAGSILVYDTPGLATAGTWPQVHKDAQNTRGYVVAFSSSSSVSSSASSSAACIDSDGGLNYTMTGTITNFLHGNNVVPSFGDVCFKDNNQNPAIDPRILLEGYCGSDGFGHLEQHICPGGCERGVCLPEQGSSSVSSSSSSSSSWEYPPLREDYVPAEGDVTSYPFLSLLHFRLPPFGPFWAALTASLHSVWATLIELRL